MWEKDSPSNPGIDMQLNISQWSSGTYLVQVKLGPKVVHKKLLHTKQIFVKRGSLKPSNELNIFQNELLKNQIRIVLSILTEKL